MTTLMSYPVEMRDGRSIFETQRLHTSQNSFLHLEVFDCGLYAAVLQIRSFGCCDNNYQVRSRQLDRTEPFFTDKKDAIRCCKKFVCDWLQCEADDQEAAYEAALERGDFEL